MEIQIGEPKRYRLIHGIIGNLVAFSLPVGVTLGSMTGAGVILAVFGGHILAAMLIMTALLVWIVGLLVAFIYFIPILDNYPFRRILRDFVTENDWEAGRIWQITLRPRIRRGLRGLLDDCDDVGVLHLEESSLRFEGDSVNLAIPFSETEKIELRSSGLGGMWVRGGKILLKVNDRGEERTFVFAERCAKTMPESRRITVDLFESLRYRFGGERPPEE